MPIPQKDINKFLEPKLKAAKKKYGITFFSSRKDKEAVERWAYSEIINDRKTCNEYRSAAERNSVLLEAKDRQSKLKLQFEQFKKDNLRYGLPNSTTKMAFIVQSKNKSWEALERKQITPAIHTMNILILNMFEKPSVGTKILVGLGLTALVAGGITAICLSGGIAAIPTLVSASFLANMVTVAGSCAIVGGGFGAINCIKKSIDTSRSLDRHLENATLERRAARELAEFKAYKSSKFALPLVTNKHPHKRIILVRKHKKAEPLKTQYNQADKRKTEPLVVQPVVAVVGSRTSHSNVM